MENPIVRRFCIQGLYGYKDVEIRFVGQQLILIAGNGSGKTTILNALYALLTRQYFRLRDLEFREIICEFSTGRGVAIRKDQLMSLQSGTNERIHHLARQAGISPEELTDFVSSEFEKLGSNWRYHSIVQSIYGRSPLDYDEVYSALKEMHQQLTLAVAPELKSSFETISAELGGCEVLYLPTYRRIENPQLSPRGKRAKLTNPVSRKRMDVPTVIHSSQMNFGLEDVEERLAQLTEEVDRIANVEYRTASAAIIDDALANKIDSSPTDNLPDIDSLRRFLSRVSEPRGDGRLGTRSDWVSERRFNAISDLYSSGNVNRPEKSFLRYFLSRLGRVIERTKETEAMLQKFVDACNGYLRESTDEKLFTYDPNLMRVAVINSWTSDEIELSQLSSGEKQIVSILARLYLYDKRNFILIDEPELSLSIDWQKKILPDIMKSGAVVQLLAITHSPFVFENELDPFAGSLSVRRNGEK